MLGFQAVVHFSYFLYVYTLASNKKMLQFKASKYNKLNLIIVFLLVELPVVILNLRKKSQVQTLTLSLLFYVSKSHIFLFFFINSL